MRILLDECVPRPFRRELPGHEVRTIQESGWAGKKNGALLALLPSQRFDAFVTVDQNLPYQQELSQSKVAVVVLSAPSNRLNDLLPLAPKVRAALDVIQPGEVVEIASQS